MDLTEVPPPGQMLESIWPLLQWFIPLCISAITALFAIFQRRATTRVEREASKRQEEHELLQLQIEDKANIELARMQHEFDRQKKFQDDLISYGQELRKECDLLRVEAREKDLKISGQQEEIMSLKEALAKLRERIKILEEQIKVLTCRNEDCLNRVSP